MALTGVNTTGMTNMDIFEQLQTVLLGYQIDEALQSVTKEELDEIYMNFTEEVKQA